MIKSLKVFGFSFLKLLMKKKVCFQEKHPLPSWHNVEKWSPSATTFWTLTLRQVDMHV